VEASVCALKPSHPPTRQVGPAYLGQLDGGPGDVALGPREQEGAVGGAVLPQRYPACSGARRSSRPGAEAPAGASCRRTAPCPHPLLQVAVQGGAGAQPGDCALCRPLGASGRLLGAGRLAARSTARMHAHAGTRGRHGTRTLWVVAAKHRPARCSAQHHSRPQAVHARVESAVAPAVLRGRVHLPAICPGPRVRMAESIQGESSSQSVRQAGREAPSRDVAVAGGCLSSVRPRQRASTHAAVQQAPGSGGTHTPERPLFKLCACQQRPAWHGRRVACCAPGGPRRRLLSCCSPEQGDLLAVTGEGGG
jgi:hypothetical protein